MTFGLIPGAGGSGWYWHRVEEELRGRGHETVEVDLPATDDSAGLAEYTAVVVEALGERDDLILVAQSMGGFTAPLVSERIPVSMIVLVNAMIPAAGEAPGDWWANTGQIEARRAMDVREGRDPDAGFDPFVSFLHDLPEHLVQEMATHEHDQSDTPFEKPWPLSAWPDLPTRVVIGRDDRFFPVEFQRRVARERLGITPDELSGGHLLALANPVELAGTLERYGAELL